MTGWSVVFLFVRLFVCLVFFSCLFISLPFSSSSLLWSSFFFRQLLKEFAQNQTGVQHWDAAQFASSAQRLALGFLFSSRFASLSLQPTLLSLRSFFFPEQILAPLFARDGQRPCPVRSSVFQLRVARAVAGWLWRGRVSRSDHDQLLGFARLAVLDGRGRQRRDLHLQRLLHCWYALFFGFCFFLFPFICSHNCFPSYSFPFFYPSSLASFSLSNE
jgi:hypothetical protein